MDSRTGAVMETGLILEYVPAEVKTQEFYYGMLDGTRILSTVTDATVPSRLEITAYYRKMAEHDPLLAPARFYSYEVFRATVCSTEGKNFITDPQFLESSSICLDGVLADRPMGRHPYMFGELSKRFKAPGRPVIAIDNNKREASCYIGEETGQSLFTVGVYKALIQRNDSYSEFPENVQTREFADYCMEHRANFRWFRQIPKKSQSSANIQTAYDYGHYYVCDFAKRFITPQMMKECYQECDYTHVILRYLFTKFCRQIGLPGKFYGKETMTPSLRDSCDDYIYYKAGNTCLASYLKEQYGPSSAHLTMTWPDSKYCTPEKVLGVPVGTFHRTWLEKIVTENDPRFVKLRVNKALKAVQAVCYYGVEKLKDLDHTETFRNTFMGRTIGYCVRCRDLTYHSDNYRTLIEGLKFGIRRMAVSVTLAKGMTPYMADMLHRKFGFCHIGITAFTADYGLDTEEACTFVQMRQIIGEEGYRPLLRNCKRKLRQISIVQ